MKSSAWSHSAVTVMHLQKRLFPKQQFYNDSQQTISFQLCHKSMYLDFIAFGSREDWKLYLTIISTSSATCFSELVGIRHVCL